MGLGLEFTFIALSDGKKEENQASNLSILGYAVISCYDSGQCGSVQEGSLSLICG